MAMRNPGKYFIRKEVQDLLIKMTGLDLKKIFKPTFNPKQLNSNIELLTDEQLEEEKRKSLDKARTLLQMPPVLNARESKQTILATDERLDPLNSTKSDYVFTDISLNVPNKKRMIVVRESNGVLRKATEQEHEKMLQVYFPQEGKPNYMPSMFKPENLEECLKLKHYLMVLNKACLKFEPNDPEFIRVTHRVYEYINEVSDFDVLYSTRFFGPMVFYLCWFKKLDNFIAHLIETSNIDDCVRVITLYSLINEQKINENSTNPLDLIKVFIENDLNNGAKSIKAFRKHCDLDKKSEVKN